MPRPWKPHPSTYKLNAQSPRLSFQECPFSLCGSMHDAKIMAPYTLANIATTNTHAWGSNGWLKN